MGWPCLLLPKEKKEKNDANSCIISYLAFSSTCFSTKTSRLKIEKNIIGNYFLWKLFNDERKNNSRDCVFLVII